MIYFLKFKILIFIYLFIYSFILFSFLFFKLVFIHYLLLIELQFLMVICLLTVYSEFHNSVIGHIFILFIISILAGETAVALSLYALLNRVNKINSENVIF